MLRLVCQLLSCDGLTLCGQRMRMSLKWNDTITFWLFEWCFLFCVIYARGQQLMSTFIARSKMQKCVLIGLCECALGALKFKFNVGLVAVGLLGQSSHSWHQQNVRRGGCKFTYHPDCPRLHLLLLLIVQDCCMACTRSLWECEHRTWRKQRNLTWTGCYFWPLI